MTPLERAILAACLPAIAWAVLCAWFSIGTAGFLLPFILALIAGAVSPGLWPGKREKGGGQSGP